MAAPLLISDEYREMQRKLHENPNYGVASVQYAPIVAEVIEAVGATNSSTTAQAKAGSARRCDGSLLRPLRIHHYDPAIPEWSAPPAPCRFVACIDVLEHIEPELLDNVLDDLRRVTIGVGFFTVHTGPAVKVLPDGRNAHLIQKPASWWLPKIMERFELVTFNRMPQGFWVGVERRPG
ncbi:MAG: hypothetical protein RML56_14825 [Burkholderiales bacterium]|nr:hypothetical protein [Burkholderiales bacterium]